MLCNCPVGVLSNVLCLNFPVSDGLGVQSERTGREINKSHPFHYYHMSVRIPPYYHNHPFTLQILGGAILVTHLFFQRETNGRLSIFGNS